jgi:hypothetical protein
MRSALQVLLVGAISAAVVLLGIGTASASVAPASAIGAAPVVSSPMVTDSHPGLLCRDHSSESTGPSGKVLVPWSYCYDPETTNHRGWHDYCTHSPDQYSSVLGNADFRGPCARHDMCLQSTHSHSRCDGPLLDNLKQNCKQRFSWYNPARYSCEDVAYTYYLAIKAYTLVS